MSIPQSGGGTIESKSQLAEYLASGCKPKSEWRIGTEHEKFGYNKQTLLPLPYDGLCSIKAMLEGLRDGFGWTPVLEGDNIIGLTRNGANVSLEPGGQFELSGATVKNIHETAAELANHLAEVKVIAERIGARFLGLGAAPIWTGEQMPVMPKGRYALMTRHMGRVGTHGTQMMYRTCTVQVNLDFSSTTPPSLRRQKDATANGSPLEIGAAASCRRGEKAMRSQNKRAPSQPGPPDAPAFGRRRSSMASELEVRARRRKG